MQKTIDACGRSCPEPVLMTKNALASGESAYEVLVDSHTAMQNVKRYAEGAGYVASVSEQEGVFHIALTRR